MEGRKTVIPCELALLAGMILVSFSVCLFIRSGYGVTVMASIPLMISYVAPVFDFGTWNIIYQAILLFIAMAITRKPGMGYVISAAECILFGFFLNMMKDLLAGIPVNFELSLLYLVIAHILLFFGVAFFMRCYIPLLPCDLFIRDVVLTFRIKYKVFKTAFDIFCMVASAAIGILFLGGIVDIGIGTLISACITGYFVSRIISGIYDRYFEFRPLTGFFSGYLSDDAPCKRE